MMKKELLAPAGDMESLKQAIHNGADAVYLAGKKFGARGFALNFTNEEIINAIKYSHLYNVKVYVTINTLIYENELKEVLDFIKFLYFNNVDAVILQDLGLISEVRKRFPLLEIHASTQVNVHNEEQIKLLEKLKVKRIILAREVSLKEIESFKTNMELEVFVHGAICVSYSGQCLFSSLLLNRSGNRGLCAQICRMPFKLLENGQEIKLSGNYLLSPKELNTLAYLEELLKSKVFSFKIEGRMKSSEYVGFVTRLYRKIIDTYEKEHIIKIEEADLKKLASLFNRDYTKGFLLDEDNKDFINIKTSNHQGIRLGKVIEVNNAKIKIKLEEDLNQEDGIRFKNEDKGLIVNYLYNEEGLLVKSVSKGEIAIVDNKINLQSKGVVLKTVDSLLVKELRKYPLLKIKINWNVEALLNKPLKIQISDGENTFIQYGSIINLAKKQEVTLETIKDKLKTLGSTPFVMANFEGVVDKNIFISLSEIKALKHILVNKLIEARENKQITEKIVDNSVEVFKPIKEEKEIFYSAVVRNEEQLKACLELNFAYIYVDDYLIYQKYKSDKRVYLWLSRIMKNYPDLNKEKIMVGEIGAISKYKNNNELVSDYFLNVVNSKTIRFLNEENVKRITLSVENSWENLKDMLNNIEANVELLVYGRWEVMVMKYCPLNYLINKDTKCHACLTKNNYALKDSHNRIYPLKNDALNHLTHIFYYKKVNYLSSLENFKSLGITTFRFDFLEETAEEIKDIVKNVKYSKVKQ